MMVADATHTGFERWCFEDQPKQQAVLHTYSYDQPVMYTRTIFSYSFSAPFKLECYGVLLKIASISKTFWKKMLGVVV